MNNTICYPASHLLFYIIVIIFITLIFFIMFWQSNEQKNYQYYYTTNNHPNELFTTTNYPIESQSNPNTLPNTITVGSHNSAHASPIIASPYVSPITSPDVSSMAKLTQMPTMPIQMLPPQFYGNIPYGNYFRN